MPDSPEAAVVYSLKKHLIQQGLRGGTISHLLVDADGSYRSSRYAKELEPMATVRIDDLRPDVLCLSRTHSQHLITAFEVKPDLRDSTKGLSQARAYRNGVHQSYLALPIPKKRNTSLARVERDAQDFGIGLLVRDAAGWHEAVAPSDPRPAPKILDDIALALRGVAMGRRFQLNHPLNYLIVPFLRMQDPDERLERLLAMHWLDLGSKGTRRHAIEGARTLGLIDLGDQLTADGLTVADLLTAIGFDPSSRPNKRQRLAQVAPPIAAIARTIMLRQPTVRLLVQALLSVPRCSCTALELLPIAREVDEVLAGALLLEDPDQIASTDYTDVRFNPSTVYKLKQTLWHAGILSSKAHPSAGSSSKEYQPDNDRWTLDERLAHLSMGAVIA